MIFTATLDNTVDGGFDVNVSTADGTATAGVDYSSVGGFTLTFAGTAGETQTFGVNPIGDSTSEPDETVLISMSGLVPVTVGTGDIDITDGATLTILNDDDSLISVNDPTVLEGDAGSATLTYTVSLNQAALGSITVDYATSDGTATAGSDYTAASGTLTFNAGETSKTVDVTIAGDEIVELDETITLTLSNATGTSQIDDATGTGTITNDDETVVTIEDISHEEDGTFTITVSSSNAVDGGFSLGVTTADNTAIAGTDYTALTSALL